MRSGDYLYVTRIFIYMDISNDNNTIAKKFVLFRIEGKSDSYSRIEETIRKAHRKLQRQPQTDNNTIIEGPSFYL